MHGVFTQWSLDLNTLSEACCGERLPSDCDHGFQCVKMLPSRCGIADDPKGQAWRQLQVVNITGT